MTEWVTPTRGDVITSIIIYVCCAALGLATAAVVVIATPLMLEAIPIVSDFLGGF